MHKSFVLCRIRNNGEAFSYAEVWEGEITYSISEPVHYKSSTFSIHYKRLEELDESYDP